MLQEAWGAWRVVVVYLGAGVLGQLASAVLAPDAIGVGSSGAAFGMATALMPLRVVRRTEILLWILCATCAHTHTHTRTRMCTHVRARTHARTHMYAHVHTHVHTYTRTYTRTYTHVHTRAHKLLTAYAFQNCSCYNVD